MKHTAKIFAVIAFLGLLAAIAAVRADTTKTEMVQFPSSTGTISGYLAAPQKPGRYPALVVVHEWWGLTDWVKEQTRKLADQGYIALAVDLYRGKVTSDPEEAHELMRGMPQDRAHAYAIGGVLVASIFVFTIGYLRYVSTPGHPILQIFGGSLLGMLSMYIATCLYETPTHA